jgi:hypothetical protein
VTLPLPLILPRLERPAFFDGQRLGPDDLEAVSRYHRELRWLHNRSLHSWGIAVGLNVTGARGDRQVTVTPGYALDCDGHDLVLTRAATLTIPAVAAAPGVPATYYLTTSWLPDDQQTITESRDGVCLGPGAVRRADEPLLRWQRPADISATRYRRGLDLILGTVSIEGCALSAPVSGAERRYARPENQPYVAAGSTPEGATEWSFHPAGGVPAGVQTVVDTSSAGFSRTPTYLAHVVGTRLLLPQNQMFDGPSQVAAPTPTSFTLQVTMPRNLTLPPYTLNPATAFTSALLDTLRSPLAWSVAWIGIES